MDTLRAAGTEELNFSGLGNEQERLEMNLNRAWLQGFHLGNGCLTIGPRGASVVSYSSAYKDLIERVASILEVEFQSCVRVAHNEDSHHYLCLSQKQNVVEWVYANIGREKRWPTDSNSWSLDLRKAFVAGLMDSDGFVSVRRNQRYWHEINHKYYVQNFACLVGFCSTSDWIVDFATLVGKMGVTFGKITKTFSAGKGFTRTKPLMKVYLKPETFIEAGCYFTGAKKLGKLIEIARERGLTVSSETIRRASKVE